MELILPKSLRKERPQYTGEHNGGLVVVVYDDEASKNSDVNQYAVFSKSGFHCWMELNWSLPELLSSLELEPTKYEDEIQNLKK